MSHRKVRWVILMIAAFLTVSMNHSCSRQSILKKNQKELHQDVDLDRDDEILIQQVFEIGSGLYKSLIDMTALYFSGILTDSNQLYERMVIEVCKHMVQVVRLLAMYGPNMLQDKKLHWKKKLQKTFYISCALIVCFASFQEIKSYQNNVLKKNNNYRSLDGLVDSGDVFREKPENIAPRQRPKITD